VVLLAVFGFIGWHMEYGTEKNVTFTVTGLDDQGNYNHHKYLVFTTRDGGQKIEVFEDTDAWLHGKHDSSDVWARFINAGKGATWDCPVYGFRNFFSSSYRDILDGCTLVSRPGQPSNADIGVRDPLAQNLYPTPTGRAPLTTQLTQTSP
jgi:hypothetical protein